MEANLPRSMTDKVYKWLNNMPISSYACPLCDAPGDCVCYTIYNTTSNSNTNSNSNSNNDLYASNSRGTDRTQVNSIGSSSSPLRHTVYEIYEDDNDSTPIEKIHGLAVENVKWNTVNSDMLIVAEGRVFPVHRNTLCKHSKVLKSKLRNEEGFILELSANATDMETVLEYLYNFGAALDSGNVREILVISRMLNIKALQEQCKNFKKNCKQSRFTKVKKRWRSISDLFIKF